MNRNRSGVWRVLGIVAGALVLAALGFVLAVVLFVPGLMYRGGTAGDGSVSYPALDEQLYSEPGVVDVAEEMARESAGAPATPMVSEDAASAPADSMVIRTASMEVRVDDVEPAIEDVRAAAAKSGGEITSLTVHAGSDGVRPLQEGSISSSDQYPATAYITIRVPAENLDELQKDVSSTGTVVSQSASADDVTEQYIDLSARMKNLKAEEARLRTFFDQAEDVEDLLAVQAELARVRGEIEAMQAQIDYLDRQVARATLTVTLTEPGPIVRPEAADWGFAEAITRGIQAAAALVNWFIVAAIALLPLFLVALLAWLVVRFIVRRRRPKTSGESTQAGSGTSVSVPPSPEDREPEA